MEGTNRNYANRSLAIRSVDWHSNPIRCPSWCSRMILGGWAWELGAAALCSFILAIIAGVLFIYNNRSVPDLPDGLTLNALISLLATLAKSTLMVILATAIRQERWLWFIKRPRPLSTVDDFDEASRGPYGSLLLVLNRRGRYVLQPSTAKSICLTISLRIIVFGLFSPQPLLSSC